MLRIKLKQLSAAAVTTFLLVGGNPAVVYAQTADQIRTANEQLSLVIVMGKLTEGAAVGEQVLTYAEKVFGKEHPETLKSVNNLAEAYKRLGRYSEAEQLFERVLKTNKKVLGNEHHDTLISVNRLALLYFTAGLYNQAEALFKRALETNQRVLGEDHPDTLDSVNRLAMVYQQQGRYSDAEPLYRRAVERRQRVLGSEASDTLVSLHNLANFYREQARYGEAEPLFMRAIDGYKRIKGEDDTDVLSMISNLAELYRVQGRYTEAEAQCMHVLAARERVLGNKHPDTLTSVNNLATIYTDQARYHDAEPLFKRALAAREEVTGQNHPDTLQSVNNLAELYRLQGKYGEAEALYKRAFAGFERVVGTDHPSTLNTANNLALLYKNLGRYDEAEPLAKRVLESYQRLLGSEHPDTITSLSNLAGLYSSQGRDSEAEPLYAQALEISERTLGPEHPQTLVGINNLAVMYERQARYDKAGSLYKRALDIRERVLGSEHIDTLLSVNNLAGNYFLRKDWARAAKYWRRGTAADVARSMHGGADVGQLLTGKQRSETARYGWQFALLIRAVHRLVQEGKETSASASRETFGTAQLALGSEAAQSLAQMAARGAKGDPTLATLVRERQDLVAEWQKRDGLRNAAFSEPADKRNAKAEVENTVRLAAIDKRVTEIDERLSKTFPDYADFANPAPLSAEDVQQLLHRDEALVLFLDTPTVKSAHQETFIWVITKTDMHWVRSELGTDALTREVQALRCGLDYTAWDGSACHGLTGTRYDQADYAAGKPLPFDIARAYRLYKGLFGEIEDLIKGKQLLLVPSGPLTQLPFHVLVTEPPVGKNYKSAVWLARKHATTVLPAVSSLKALRRISRPSAAAKPLIGFGNPLLKGPDSRYAKRAKLAQEKQNCREAGWNRLAMFLGLRNSVVPIETHGTLATPSFIRMQSPLPETADELCEVAHDIGADMHDMHLGARATEREVKRLSESGELSQFRIVHFATHGAMAGELRKDIEPGLILTPPDTASEEDDGYLTASEIASLKLDADWVILSACNTAAGNASNAEALSGLARAFIYAQTRALLVSHWAVNSDATVKLITSAVQEIAQNKDVGRAEALRRAMLVLIDSGDHRRVHPAFWAPFTVVGEGGGG
jgi:CHAT domain-containing protein/tetratricopeptide (TPR) repeat protein